MLALATIYPKNLNPTNPWFSGECSESAAQVNEAQAAGAQRVTAAEVSQDAETFEEGSAEALQQLYNTTIAPGTPLQVHVDGEAGKAVTLRVSRPMDAAAPSITGNATITPGDEVTDALIPWTTQVFTVTDIGASGADVTIAAGTSTEVLVQTSVQGPDLQDAQATRVSASTVQVSVKATGLDVPSGALSVTAAGTLTSTPMIAAADDTYSAQVAAPAGQVNRFIIQLASTTSRVVMAEEAAPAQSVKVTFPEVADLSRQAGSADRDLQIPLRLDTTAAQDAGPVHITVDLDINGTVIPSQFNADLTQGTTWAEVAVLESDLEAAGISGDLKITPKRVTVTAETADGDLRPLSDLTAFTSLPVVSVAEPTTVPDNVLPVADAKVSVANLTTTFDASGSTDSDGLITGYRWDFGDGTTSTEAAPQHTYTAAGTYPVILQVTDVDGGTTQTSLPVTVGGATPLTVLASDAFLRTTSSGWGNADTGGAWTLSDAAATEGTADGKAQLTLNAPGDQRSAQLAAVSSGDTAVGVTLSIDKMPSGEGLVASLTGREVPGAGGYAATTNLGGDGLVTVALARRSVDAGSGASVTLASAPVTGLTYAAGQQLRMRLQVVGTKPTALAAKIWPVGTAEPADWQVSATDATAALQVPGSLAVDAALAASASNAPVAVTFSHLAATTTGEVPANKVPVAAFSATPTGLTAALDASASSDADGNVASYAWAFGDGTTAAASSSATASHTYTAAGTYPVTLTVTDDKGATATVAKDVVVTAPPAITTLMKDTFTRTTTSGWGSADEGGAWTPTSGAASFSTTGAQGKITVGAAGQTRSIYAASVSTTDADVAATFSLDKLSDGANYVHVYGRRVSASDDYKASMRIGADGKVTLALAKAVGGSGTTLKSVSVPNLTCTAGQHLRVRLQVTGSGTTTLRAKVWPADTAEPTTWLASATDTTEALQAAGSIGLGGYLSTTTTNAPGSILFEDITATTS